MRGNAGFGGPEQATRCERRLLEDHHHLHNHGPPNQDSLCISPRLKIGSNLKLNVCIREVSERLEEVQEISRQAYECLKQRLVILGVLTRARVEVARVIDL